MSESDIVPFVDTTDAGHEQAFKRGHIVPDGAVNLAYIKTPELSPANNITILDNTANFAQNSLNSQVVQTNIYFADILGKLQDANGNQLILDNAPVVSDIFLVDESKHDTSLYTSDTILALVHESRYFHIDFVSLDANGQLTNYISSYIKIIDNNGHEYVDTNGVPKYKIKIIAPPIAQTQTFQRAYRVFAYVQYDALGKDLFLAYNKIEMDDSGNYSNQVFDYKEILNPQPYISFQNETALVVDPANRNFNWFSTQTSTLKNEILGLPVPAQEGYNVYVTKKAIPDPRIFQLFRWRLNCVFNKDYQVEEESLFSIVKCGVVITDANPTSYSPYVFYNLEVSDYNNKHIRFVNPNWVKLGNVDNQEAQQTAAYWYVNFDTITDEDLAQYDVLIWAPTTTTFNFSPYAGHIDYFTRVLGRTLIVDTNNVCVITGLTGITVSSPVSNGGIQTVQSTSAVGAGYSNATTVRTASNPPDGLFDLSSLSGWTFTDNDDNSITYKQQLSSPSSMHYISNYSGYTPIVQSQDNNYVPLETISTNLYQAQNSSSYQFGGLFNPTLTVKAPPVLANTTAVQLEATLKINVNTSTITSFQGPYNISINGGGQSIQQQVYLTSFSQPINLTLYIPLYSTNLSNITFSAYTDIPQSYIASGSLTAALEFSSTSSLTNLLAESGNTVTVAAEQKFSSSGRLIVSTASILATCNMVLNPFAPAVISDNQGVAIYQNESYGDYVNSVVAAGAYKLIYNLILLATQNKNLNTDIHTDFASSWLLSTPWNTSWTIDASVLTPAEIKQYDFSYGYIDLSTPIQVWQRQLAPISCKELIDATLTDDMSTRIVGTNRQYALEVTNPQVSVPIDIGDQTIPFAWTTAYTPEFTIPTGINAYVIQDETVTGSYGSGQYLDRAYPPKPYSVQTKLTYIDTEVSSATPTSTAGTSLTVEWTAVGTAHVTNTGAQPIPTLNSTIELTWANNSDKSTRIGGANPYQGASIADGIWIGSSEYPTNELAWMNANAWPYMGVYGVYQLGDTGDLVRFLQDALNRFQNLGLFTLTAGILAVTGIFDTKTQQNVILFQQQMKALTQNGVVDAETWSLIGGQILRLGSSIGPVGDDYTKYYAYPAQYMQMSSISDGNSNTKWAKVSDYAVTADAHGHTAASTVPQTAETFYIYFDQDYTINSIFVTPYLEGNGQSVEITQVQVRSNNNVTYTQALHQNATNGQRSEIVIGSAVGNNIAVTLLQTQSSGRGASLFLGVSDISAVVTVPTGSAGGNVLSQSGLYSLQDFQTVVLATTGSETVTAVAPSNVGTFSQVNWTDIVVNTGVTQKGVLGEFPNMPVYWNDDTLFDNLTNAPAFYGPNGEPAIGFQSTTPIPTGSNVWQMPDGRWVSYTSGNFNYPTSLGFAPNTPIGSPLVTASITVGGTITFTPTALGAIGNDFFVNNTFSASHIAIGEQIPDPTNVNTYYSKTILGGISPIPEIGFVSKKEGIKLLCNAQGAPVGFDFPAIDTPVASHTFQFTNISLSVLGTDPTVVAGFYDIAAEEFILNGEGISNYEMTYSEYLRRGPQNVYVAVVTTYELDQTMPYPLSNAAAQIPFRWIMPIYGVTTHGGSKISIQPLSPNLNYANVWPVAVRTGAFSTQIVLRPNSGSAQYSTGPYVNYLNHYQTSVPMAITAYYSIPEASIGGWSFSYGWPYKDIINEEPALLENDHIQVRQPPILMRQSATAIPSMADPMRPILTIQQNINNVWTKLTLADVSDYNVYTGEIYLKNALIDPDPSLLSVSYTSTNNDYNFKGFDIFNTINLNPYNGSFSSGKISQPIYIYMLPEYIVINNTNQIIPQSVQTRTLRFTFSYDLFDPFAAAYDPTALLLGTVYVSSSIDVADIVLIDSRRRGGGIKDSISEAEARRIANDATAYWDIQYSLGAGYQKSGFVLIKLPAEITNDFSDTDIRKVIAKNITAGVAFQIEETL